MKSLINLVRMWCILAYHALAESVKLGTNYLVKVKVNFGSGADNQKGYGIRNLENVYLT